MIEIAAWIIGGLWGLYFLKGAIGMLLGHAGDHNWFLWPPVIFGLMPFAITKFLFDIDTAMVVVVVLNGGIVLTALVAAGVDKFKSTRTESDSQ